jgi:hypothetical protein
MKELKLLSLVLVAGAATMLAACTSESDNSPSAKISYESVAAAQQVPVTFGTYLGEQADTRAVVNATPGAMTNATLQTSGFGVFAFYTGTSDYAAGQSTLAPNFMFNEKVSTSSWTYSPVKYWPNEFDAGAVDNQDAGASDNPAEGSVAGGKLSFFAYAPWVGDEASNNVTTGLAAAGITGTSANNTKSDPYVSFVKTSTDNVDLLWGTAGDASYKNTAGTTVTAPTLTGGKAAVNANFTKQKSSGKVNFAFKHALAKIGSIYVVSDIATESAATGGSQDATTKITVTGVTITSSAIQTTGNLNLATGVWTLNASPTGALTYTIALADIATTYAEPASVSAWSDLSSTEGVTTTAGELLNATALSSKLFTFLPGTQPNLTVSITYIVRTEDGALSKGYSEVSQTITKTIAFSEAFAINKNYRLTLHLGLTGVDFTASVSEWEAAGNNDPVNLPINVVS